MGPDFTPATTAAQRLKTASDEMRHRFSSDFMEPFVLFGLFLGLIGKIYQDGTHDDHERN
jgi:hypothetical protein